MPEKRYPEQDEATALFEQFQDFLEQMKSQGVPFVASLSIPTVLEEEEKLPYLDPKNQVAIRQVVQFNHCQVGFAANLLSDAVEMLYNEECQCGQCKLYKEAAQDEQEQGGEHDEYCC